MVNRVADSTNYSGRVSETVTSHSGVPNGVLARMQQAQVTRDVDHDHDVLSRGRTMQAVRNCVPEVHA